MTVTAAPRTAPTTYASFLPLLLAAVALVTGLWLSMAGNDVLEVEDAVDGVMLMGFPWVGGLLLRRGLHTRIGVLCCVVGLATGLGYLMGGYAAHDWPGRSVAAVLGSATFVVTIALLLNVMPLIFPDGQLPSRRWRVVAWAGVGGAALAVLSIVMMPGAVDEDVPALGDNPLGVRPLSPALEIAELVSLVTFMAVALLGISSLVVRWRGSDATERRQVAILLGGVAVLVGLFLLDSTLQSVGGAVYGVVAAVVALGAVPGAIALALLRDQGRRPGCLPTPG